MTTDQLAYLAGLLEGEGCFALHAGKYPQVVLQMQDEDVVRRAASLIPGARVCELSRREGHSRPSFKMQVNGKIAKELMRAMIPFMGERRTARIREILNF